MKDLNIGNNIFRIKKMNAIEVLSLQSSMSMQNFKDILGSYKTMLEKIEVKFKDNWLPVKEEGKEIYYPAGIEDRISDIEKLIVYFMEFLKEVFPKSNA